MKVYVVICAHGGLVAPDYQLFKRKVDAKREACRIIREAREPGRTFATESIHKSGMCCLHYGCRNGYHIALTVCVEERESRNYPGYKIN